jgi:hypothetical protein
MESTEHDALMGAMAALVSLMARKGFPLGELMTSVQAVAKLMRESGKADAADLMEKNWRNTLSGLSLALGDHGPPQ